jgi:hypothetical protein
LEVYQQFLFVPEEVKALLIILMNDPLSIPISLPQMHCIFCSRAVKLYFWVILVLWHRNTSPGPILSYFQSLFLHAAQRITSIFPMLFGSIFYCTFDHCGLDWLPQHTDILYFRAGQGQARFL